MEAKMSKFFDSVGAFFTGGDNIPWCDRDIIAVSALVCLMDLPPTCEIFAVDGGLMNSRVAYAHHVRRLLGASSMLDAALVVGDQPIC
jgi:hypothetical protein